MTNKRYIVSGATGYIGRFIVEQLLSSGHQILVLGRTKPADSLFSQPVDFAHMSLSQGEFDPAIFDGYGGFIHTAFDHIPGRYRGGEGDDPDRFIRLNHAGSMALFEAAKTAGVARVLFLSSRAVYGPQTQGAPLYETTDTHPDTVYGQVKLQTEQALAALASVADPHFLPIIIRATGVYGAASTAGPSDHKWHELFGDFTADKTIAPRAGTEVHGDDLAKAVELLLTTEATKLINAADGDTAPIFNVSDILLDRQELLQTYRDMNAFNGGQIPQTVDVTQYNSMDCSRLKSLGWQPRGRLDLSWLAHA